MTEMRTITDREQWLKWRDEYLNASEIARCYGLDPHHTLAQLVAQKRGVKGLGPDPDNPMIERGNDLEEIAAKKLKRKFPTWDVHKCNSYFVDQQHRQGATPDYLVIDPARTGMGVAQLKVVAEPVHKANWLDDTPPYHVILQTMQEMLLTDASWGVIVALVIGNFTYDLHVYPIERHRNAETRLVSTADAFWRAFDAGEDPTLDYERDGKLIALMYPHETPGKVIDLSTDNAIRELLDQRELLREQAGALEKKLEATDNEIKAKLKDGESFLIPGWRVTFKAQQRKEYVVRATSYRVLRAARLAAAPQVTP